MNIKVLGGGCASCQVLYAHIEEMAKELGMKIELEKVTDYAEIATYGVMSTPAVVIDGKVVANGKLSKKQVKDLLSS